MPAHERNKLCMVWAAAGQDHECSECGAREIRYVGGTPTVTVTKLQEM
jgi:hypothetical protein